MVRAFPPSVTRLGLAGRVHADGGGGGYAEGVEEGEELGGYTLIRRLGTGGAGTVWLAEDGGGMRVALKALHPALAASEASRARLERETRTVNSVRSPFVAHIVDAETDALQPFVVSEYVEGPTLAEIVISGPIPLRGVAALSYHLASTIAAVHHADIIHRDIKPSNIICSPRGPVLIDFGIAMATSDQHLTRTGLVSGTSGYTAPELLEGHGASKESDWWAWCATLLSCATGRPPFGAGDVSATMLRVLEGDPDVAGLHPALADALAGGLAPDPQERPSPSLIVADLMGAVGWAPGELDYVAVNWAALLDTGVRTQRLSSAPQEIAAPPQWDDAAQRPRGAGARHIPSSSFPHEEADDWDSEVGASSQEGETRESWLREGSDPTEVISSYGRGGLGDPQSPLAHDQRSAYAPDAFAATGTEDPSPHWVPGQGDGDDGYDDEETPASSPMRGAWISGATVLALLAALPFLLGASGTMLVGVALTAFGLVGALFRWRERRRSLRGPRASDTVALIAMSPLLLARSILATSLAFVFSAIVPYVIWVAVSYGHEGRFLWSWPFDVAAATTLSREDYWLSDPKASIIVWALSAFTIIVTWLFPVAEDLRVGLAVSLRAVVRPAWGRALLAVGCVVVLVGSWLATTGGLSH